MEPSFNEQSCKSELHKITKNNQEVSVDRRDAQIMKEEARVCSQEALDVLEVAK